MASAGKPRSNQHLRTRKDLLLAAARLLKEGRQPTMDEVAEAALVSRATAYRYFPTLESLLIEAPLDGAVPDPGALFAAETSPDPEDRLERAEAALHRMVYQNEAQLRLMLANRERASRPSGRTWNASRHNSRQAAIRVCPPRMRARRRDPAQIPGCGLPRSNRN